MSVRSVLPNGTLLFEIALTALGIVSIAFPLALVIILVCRWPAQMGSAAAARKSRRCGWGQRRLCAVLV